MAKKKSKVSARKVLKDIEYVNTAPGERRCPWCGYKLWDGHSPTCQLAEALGKDSVWPHKLQEK